MKDGRGGSRLHAPRAASPSAPRTNRARHNSGDDERVQHVGGRLCRVHGVHSVCGKGRRQFLRRLPAGVGRRLPQRRGVGSAAAAAAVGGSRCLAVLPVSLLRSWTSRSSQNLLQGIQGRSPSRCSRSQRHGVLVLDHSSVSRPGPLTEAEVIQTDRDWVSVSRRYGSHSNSGLGAARSSWCTTTVICEKQHTHPSIDCSTGCCPSPEPLVCRCAGR